jgi:hypothetical protein
MSDTYHLLKPRKIILEDDLLSFDQEAILSLVRDIVHENISDIIGESIETPRIVLGEATAETAIGLHRLVTYNHSGKIIAAGFSNPQVIGLTLQAAPSAGARIPVLLSGIVQDSGWTFNPVDRIVMDNHGRPVQTDVREFPIIVPVGRFVLPDSFFLDIGSPIK